MGWPLYRDHKESHLDRTTGEARALAAGSHACSPDAGRASTPAGDLAVNRGGQSKKEPLMGYKGRKL
ncbi:Centromere Protein P [Manis pentadactyla]|nr:Centromere Protein P [Manis pentadactyla]